VTYVAVFERLKSEDGSSDGNSVVFVLDGLPYLRGSTACQLEMVEEGRCNFACDPRVLPTKGAHSMKYDVPMPAGSDDFLNSLSEDWYADFSPDTEVAAAESKAQECVFALPDDGQSVLFGNAPQNDQPGLINFRVRQA
jgi:hypothetical protein